MFIYSNCSNFCKLDRSGFESDYFWLSCFVFRYCDFEFFIFSWLFPIVCNLFPIISDWIL